MRSHILWILTIPVVSDVRFLIRGVCVHVPIEFRAINCQNYGFYRQNAGGRLVYIDDMVMRYWGVDEPTWRWVGANVICVTC